MRLLFADKAKRDDKYRELRQSLPAHLVRRGSTGPQQIHPMYVEDRKDTAAGQDRGFGNTVYKTYFKNLYEVEWES